MAYDDEDDAQPAGAHSPALQQFVGAFDNAEPGAQKWAHEAAIRLNDYFQRRRIAQQNTQIGQQFRNDIDQFRGGLMGMVRNDPIALHTALDLVHPTVTALIGTMPGAPDDAHIHHAAVAGEIQRDIASAGITSAAERSEPLARALLDNDRVKGILGDELHGHLSTYTDLQHQARQQDADAQEQAAAAARTHVGRQSAINYLSALSDGNGQLQFPDGWNQGVMADPALPPLGKALVGNVYNTLRTQGDAPESDPFVAARMIGDMANGQPPGVPDILPHAATSLRLGDALHLMNLSQAGGTAKGSIDALHAAAQLGEKTLASPENGPAGERAFSRYMNWLLPAARAGAVLDPSSPEYALGGNRMQLFAPKASDAVDTIIPPKADRPPLSSIFFRPGPSESNAPSPKLNDRETVMEVTRDMRMGATGDKGMEKQTPENSHIMLAPEVLPGIPGMTQTEDKNI